jgi:hypothetical protein
MFAVKRLGADIDPYELPSTALRNFEAMLIQAATGEGEHPSADNLPSDGSMIMRTRTDANTGTKFNEFYGRCSFIADMSRGGQRVLRLMNPKTGDVLKDQGSRRIHAARCGGDAVGRRRL